MDVVSRIVGRVELDDPIDGGNVEAGRGSATRYLNEVLKSDVPPRCDVGTEQRAMRSVAELEKGVGPLLLLLLALCAGQHDISASRDGQARMQV